MIAALRNPVNDRTAFIVTLEKPVLTKEEREELNSLINYFNTGEMTPEIKARNEQIEETLRLSKVQRRKAARERRRGSWIRRFQAI